MSLHQCPYPGCKKQLPFHILACYPHWRIVPRRLQVALNAAWHGTGSTDRYNEVRAEVVAFMEEHHGRD